MSQLSEEFPSIRMKVPRMRDTCRLEKHVPAISSPDAAGFVVQVQDQLMTVRESAGYLRMSESFLNKARLNGAGPPFVRIGRKVLYRRSAVDAWLTERQFT